jgi:arylsulfatase A-like enzyme
MPPQNGLDRRDFLKTVGAAVLTAGAVSSTGAPVQAAHGPTRKSTVTALPEQPNIMFLITDQERHPQYWPDGWADTNLPNRKRLADKGLSFSHAFCAASMCSPSRATFFTGLYPEQHGVVDTLSFGGTASVDQPQLPLDIQNMAKLLKSAGYAVQYRGKWHMSKGADGNDATPQDLANYGFDGWVAPDAGEDANPKNFGGGCPANDEKYIAQAIDFLNSPAAGGPKPWALIVSLVNPHDVLSYAQTWDSEDSNEPGCFNYRDQAPDCFEQGIGLPPTYGENLRRNFKPTAHAQLLELLAAGLGPLLPLRREPEKYVNFYAYLQKYTDLQLGALLDALETPQDLAEKTVVFRFSDHGELGLSHGGLRQKMYNVYEEMLNVPLVVSNPVLFPQPVQTEALASLVDLMPTLATLAKVPDRSQWDFKGVDLMPVISDASQNPANPTVTVQDNILFTFDDQNAGAPNGQKIVQQPNHIRCVRDVRYKYAVYFDPGGVEDQQFELYDLQTDPYELHNMANPANTDFYDPDKTAEMAAKLKAHMDAAGLAAIPPLVYMPAIGKAAED